MCNQAVDNYAHALEFVPELYKTQEMCDKAANTCFLYLILFPIDKTTTKCVTELFMLMQWPNRYKTQRICDEAVNDCLDGLRFIPDWFVTIKMLDKFYDVLNATDDILV